LVPTGTNQQGRSLLNPANKFQRIRYPSPFSASIAIIDWEDNFDLRGQMLGQHQGNQRERRRPLSGLQWKP
jgi:hypothetical protein